MSVGEFRHTGLPAHVAFGRGTLSHLAEEAARLMIRRALVISTPGQRGLAERAAAVLGDGKARVFAGAVMHTPVAVTEDALAHVRGDRINGLVAIGGGSAIGLSKALALRTGLPQIAIPTTYAGSEATPVLGETKGGEKITQRSIGVLPRVILYDVDLSLKLPRAVSMTSGLNAMAHAAEALYAPDGNPLVSLMAEDALAAMIEALPRIHARPDDIDGRSSALYGAWLSGSCLGMVSMALHHKICHTLGGAFGLPHAETHAVMLPHALAYNLAAAPDARRRLARLLRHDEPAVALARFARGLGAPHALRGIGMPEDGLDHAADLALRDPYANPRPVERDAIRAMLNRAWTGELPTSEV